MKKFRYIFVFLLINFFSIMSVNALTTTSLEGNIVASPGDTIKYAITVDTDKTIAMYDATLAFDSSVLDLVAITAKTFKGTTNVGTRELKFRSTGQTGKFTVAELTFKVNSNVSVRSVNIELNPVLVCSIDGAVEEAPTVCPSTAITLESIKYTVSIKSKINTLKSLKLNGVSVDGFAPNNYNYIMNMDATTESVKIEAVLSDTKASFQTNFGNRTEKLQYGENNFKIKVLSESGAEQIYNLEITREDNRGTNNYLSEIIVNGTKLKDFKSKTLSYKVYSYKAETALIEAKTVDNKASYKVDGPKDLIIGDNPYKIIVTSESGEVLTYNVNVVNIDREISKKLNTLSIKGYNIDFDKNTNRYEILFNKRLVSKMNIFYRPEESDDFVTVTLRPDIKNISDERAKLKPGDEIVVTVTGIDGEKGEYTIILKKDHRISFFLILGLLILAILIFVFYKLSKKKNKEEETKGRPKSSKRAAYEEKPRRRSRFSIYEDEYEEVEVPVTEELKIPSGLDDTLEISTKELRLRK